MNEFFAMVQYITEDPNSSQLRFSKPTMYFSLYRLKSESPSLTLPEACCSLIQMKTEEIRLLEVQIPLIKKLLDYVIKDEGSYDTKDLDPKCHRCQGQIIGSHLRGTVLTRKCNLLCALTDAAYLRLKDIEGDISIIVNRIIQIKKDISSLEKCQRQVLPSDQTFVHKYSSRSQALLKKCQSINAHKMKVTKAKEDDPGDPGDPCESSDDEKVRVKLSPRRREVKKLRKEKRRMLRDQQMKECLDKLYPL